MSAAATAPALRTGRGAGAGSPLTRRRRRLAGPFLAPAVLLYTALFIAPTLYSVYASFTSWDGVDPPKWNGVHNYTALFHDPAFTSAFGNTLELLFGCGAVIFVLSFAFMLLLREMKGRKFIQGVIFLPHIISGVVLAIFWGFLLRYDGMLNNLLSHFGAGPVQWLSPQRAFTAILAALVWINTGYYVTILMAGVDRIPPYFYEEAKLAGASAWQRFRHVTLPLSWDVVGTAAVLWTITSVKTFEFILAFSSTQGALPPTSQWTSALFVYGETVGGTTPAYEFGYAAASAVVTLAAVVLVVLVIRRLMRREPLEF